MSRPGGSTAYRMARDLGDHEADIGVTDAMELVRLGLRYGSQPFRVGRAGGITTKTAMRLLQSGWIDMTFAADTHITTSITPLTDDQSQAPYWLSVHQTPDPQGGLDGAWASLSSHAVQSFTEAAQRLGLQAELQILIPAEPNSSFADGPPASSDTPGTTVAQMVLTSDLHSDGSIDGGEWADTQLRLPEA